MSLKPPAPPRSPWQQVYGAIHRLRRGYYRRRARALPRPVISVGNLHWGGSGKTPLVAAIAAHLRDGGLRVAILSRGYGGRGTGVRVVSDGRGPLLPPDQAGDEPVLLADLLPGVAVVVAPDRHAAGLAAMALAPPPDLFLLDDGFSHLKLARDLDLVAFPAADPFGGGRLLPSGRLREPLAAVSRADAAILTGVAPEEAATAGAELASALRSRGFRGPGFASVSKTAPPYLVTASGREPLPAGSQVVLASAVARPEAFASAVRGHGYTIAAELRFPDHHRYPAASLARIEAAFRDSGAVAVVATEKDRVKLAGRLAVPLAALPLTACPEPAFWTWLDAAVERLR